MISNETRFFLSVEKGEHWVWKGPLNNARYPTFNHYDADKKKFTQLVANKYAWMLVGNRPVARSKHLWPTCGVRLCINPGHQEVISHSTIVARATQSAVPQRLRAT